MNALDIRAQEASARLRALVHDAPLHPLAPVAIPTGNALLPMLTAAATVIAAIVVVVWLVVPAPEVGVPAATTVTTTGATTITSQSSSTTVPVTVLAPVTTSPPVPADVTPPIITITEPVNGAELFEKNIRFVGTTEPGARVFAGQYEATVDGTGRWEISLILAEGANTASFRAVDAAGNAAEAVVTVYYAPPVTTTTIKEGELAPFEAHFTFGECNLTPPYDEYYGKGQPGSEVKVESEYGFGSTVVDGQGNWYVKVFFPEAPSFVGFLVRVTDQYGRTATFEFVSTVAK